MIRRVGSSRLGFFAMSDIDPESASLVLVGRLLKQVCDLEEKLNEAIAAILNVDDTKKVHLVHKYSFQRKKINILRSFVDNANLTEADKKHFDSALVSMGNPGHPHRGAVYDLSAAADQFLV